jgi:LPXTG-site transpeptidase (sortase) family protein
VTVRRSLAFALLASGGILCAIAGLHYLRGYEAQREARRVFEARLQTQRAAPELPVLPAGRSLASAPAPDTAQPEPSLPDTPKPEPYPQGQPIAWLMIPSLRIDAIVFGGSDGKTLEKGPGHVPGTELPGRRSGLNNCVITAHRDATFRNLQRVRMGERIELTTPNGQESYRVVSREIVDPSDVAVLAPTPSPRLTLITCYPFNFMGHAPKRLVVVAEPDLPSGPTQDALR